MALAGKKSKAKPAPELPDRSKTDMKRFYRSVDWLAWWEDFYLGLTSAGTPKYRGVREFAKSKAENDVQKDFIEYYIGPTVPIEEVPKDWKFVEPQDWLQKRKTGGWYAPKTLQAISQQITKANQSLEAMQEIGHKFTVKMLARYASLMDQLDAEMGGHFFSPDLNMQDNRRRAGMYVRLHREILTLMEKAQDLYAKNHGVNYMMDGISQLMLGAKMNDALAGGDPQQNRIKGVVNKIIDMTLTKSTTHDVPLPDEMTEQITALVPAVKNKPN